MARQVGKKSVANLLQDSSLLLTFASSGGYATAMVLELYADSSGFLVRILRDGQPLKLGICESKASYQLFATWRTLRVGWRRLDKDKIDRIL